MKSFKKLLIILVAVAYCSVLFYGCKKDDSDDPASRVAGAKISKVTEYVNGKVYSTVTYQYDGSGRLSKSIYNNGQYTTLEYSASSVIVKEFSEDGDPDDDYVVITLNSQGLHTTDGFTTFEYDKDGFLIRQFDSHNQDKNYVIANGNTVSSYGTWEWGYEETYELLMDKKNTIGNENMGIFFFGKQDANLRSSITSKNKDQYGKWYTYKDSYTYEYDSKNRVIKKTEISEGEPNSNSYTTYTYID